MRMQFVDESYHYHSHFGGAGEFERITGYKYGTPDAMNIARSKNIEYLIGLIKISTR